MSSAVLILNRLMEQAGISDNKEHLLEQASYAVDNVHQRLLRNFEEYVQEISAELGHTPEFNASTDNEDGKNPMPAWVTGAKVQDATQKVLRLSYWKRENGISYILLRIELDSKDRPKYYDLVLGARRRTKTEPIKIGKLRNTDPTFIGWVKRLLTFNKGAQ